MNTTGEDELIHDLRRRLRRAGGGELIGDDAAVLPAGGPRAVTVDQQIEGVHFPEGLDPAIVARRLLAVNISDLAAMGARPRYALLALAAPEPGVARAILASMAAACRRQRIDLAGGDLARGPRLAAALVLVGIRFPGGRWLRRANARVGDRVWVGGTLGESAAGRLLLAAGARVERGRALLPPALDLPPTLHPASRRAVRRHLSPPDQLPLSRWLGGRRRAAAIDLSDGLGSDLARLCRESGVGAEIRSGDLPRAPRFAALCAALGADPLELALTGGEDYVLAFTLGPRTRPPGGLRCRAIGRIVPGGRLRLLGAGPPGPPAAGWDHFRD